VASATPGGVGGWRAGGAAAGAVMGAVRIAMVGASSAHGTPKGVSQWVGEEQVLASFCVRGSVCVEPVTRVDESVQYAAILETARKNHVACARVGRIALPDLRHYGLWAGGARSPRCGARCEPRGAGDTRRAGGGAAGANGRPGFPAHRCRGQRCPGSPAPATGGTDGAATRCHLRGTPAGRGAALVACGCHPGRGGHRWAGICRGHLPRHHGADPGRGAAAAAGVGGSAGQRRRVDH